MTYTERFEITEDEKEFMIELVAKVLKERINKLAKHVVRNELEAVLAAEYRSVGEIKIEFACTQATQDLFSALAGFRLGRSKGTV